MCYARFVNMQQPAPHVSMIQGVSAHTLCRGVFWMRNILADSKQRHKVCRLGMHEQAEQRLPSELAHRFSTYTVHGADLLMQVGIQDHFVMPTLNLKAGSLSLHDNNRTKRKFCACYSDDVAFCLHLEY